MTDLVALGLDAQALLKALYEARANAALEIEYSDNGVSRRVRYRSDADLARAISAIEASIASAAGAPRVSVVNIRSEKGWL
jgi:hypothetical protein